MAANVAFYSSSPPRAVFAWKVSVPEAEAESIRRPSGNHGGVPQHHHGRGNGGLSLLLGNARGTQSLCAPSNLSDTDLSFASTSCSFPSLGSSAEPVSARDCFDSRSGGASGMNIPLTSASSVWARDRSPMSIFSQIGSSRTSSVPSLGPWDRPSTTAPTSLASFDSHIQASRRKPLPLAQDCERRSYALSLPDCRAPVFQSVGFRLGNDGPVTLASSEALLRSSRNVSAEDLDEGGRAAFSRAEVSLRDGIMGECESEDKADQIGDDWFLVSPEQELTSMDGTWLHAQMQLQMEETNSRGKSSQNVAPLGDRVAERGMKGLEDEPYALGLGLGFRQKNKDVELARMRLSKLVEKTADVPGMEGGAWETSVLPGRNGRGIAMTEDDEELLQEAQSRHAVFADPLVKKAFAVAASAHHGQVRKDGSVFITHCLETAMNLALVGADKSVVSAGLLHDVLDDSMLGEQELSTMFGEELTGLVVGVSKLSKFSQLARDNNTANSAKEASRLRSMFLSMADVRVVLIKLADRLHNLRTLEALPHATRLRVSEESLEIFASLANRLGIWSWKAEIEDLCFRYLHPEEHKHLSSKLERGEGEEVVMSVIRKLDGALRGCGLKVEDLSGRPKNLFSIYEKMRKKGRSVEEIFDVRGVRVIMPDAESCYAAMETVHGLWKQSGEGHYKDYIKNPKGNGYQSLHTVIEIESGHSVEIQIRTRAMHHQAECGLAAHWQYKEGEEAQHSDSMRRRVEWARWILSWQVERLDRKLRLAPLEASLRPPCPFPEHSEGCRFAGGMGHIPKELQASDCDPLYVLVLEGDKMSVQELPSGTTTGDVIQNWQKARGSGDDLTVGDVVCQALLNEELSDDRSQVLRMGDVLELALLQSEEAPLLSLLPLHAVEALEDGFPAPAILSDERAVTGGMEFVMDEVDGCGLFEEFRAPTEAWFWTEHRAVVPAGVHAFY
eukprot:TRINITY_DN38610_c0_g1_i1.p1 TRINITY_DN38610_c0_g1~~TRINITY_DN38610_c0_g1_i1.p1  ORF type:complete len:956 (+),score=136.67 TRINITY_DN38610_c0_g1_i1:160-3027(+)